MDPTTLKLLEGLVEQAKLMGYGKMRVQVTTEFELDVHAGTIQGWEVAEKPRMNVKDVRRRESVIG